MKYDLIIIGAGPAGYIAAIRAGQTGLKTALIEKKYIGGMCLNWGCITTKAIIESARFYDKLKNASNLGIDGVNTSNISFNWQKAKLRAEKIVKKLSTNISNLLEKNMVEVIFGEARINSAGSVTVTNRNLEAENIIIATGSYPAAPDTNVSKDMIFGPDQLFQLPELPDNIVIYGLGPVAVEMAQFFQMIGKKVSLVATNKHLLPGMDKYLSDYIAKKLKTVNISVIYADNFQKSANGNEIIAAGKTLKCDMILNCSTRNAIIPHSDIEIRKKGGFISTNLFLQTNIPNIYAIGDVNGQSYLAHPASAQGLFVVNKINGIKGQIDLHSYPFNIYTHPEMAQTGKTEQELKAMEIEYNISLYPLSVNGKALAEDEPQGVVRILSEKKFGEVLGVQIIASNATDLISEASAFMSFEATVYDVARTLHAHPTVSEVFMNAAQIAANDTEQQLFS